MDNSQRLELVRKLDKEIGLDELLRNLGLKNVTRNGHNIYSVCPFHEGADNPTGFSVNANKGFGYCFTQCHKSFSIFDIVMEVRDCDFADAVRYLSELVDFDYSFNGRRKNDGSDNRSFLSQVKKANETLTNLEAKPPPFSKAILDDFIPSLHTILRKEGFDNKVRDYFNLGFCIDGYLRNRITIPVDSADGDIITVSGRSVMTDEDILFTGEKKYKIYYDTDKGSTLYNLSRAFYYAQLDGYIIVVEGFKSVWRLHQWGYRNVVAVMGSALTETQALLLIQLNVKIVVVGDKDNAGGILNEEVANAVKKYSEVAILDMALLDVPKKSSVSDISLGQFKYLLENEKEVV